MTITQIIPLLKQSPYYTKQNLALALNVAPDSLDYWIKKLIANNLLLAIKKGFYISSYYLDLISQEITQKTLYLEYLANNLRTPSYVSLEYVLSQAGIIPESVFSLTSITNKSSRAYSSNLASFTYKNIKANLFFGFTTKTFKDKQIKVATSAKALFDFLYLKPLPTSPSLISQFLLTESRINWDVLSAKDKKQFIKIANLSQSKKMQTIIKLLIAKNILKK